MIGSIFAAIGDTILYNDKQVLTLRFQRKILQAFSFLFTALTILYILYTFVDFDVVIMNVPSFAMLISLEFIKDIIIYNLLGCDYFKRLRDEMEKVRLRK